MWLESIEKRSESGTVFNPKKHIIWIKLKKQKIQFKKSQILIGISAVEE